MTTTNYYDATRINPETIDAASAQELESFLAELDSALAACLSLDDKSKTRVGVRLHGVLDHIKIRMSKVDHSKELDTQFRSIAKRLLKEVFHIETQ